ncbi:MAG: hypothetical protein E6G45_11310 [Actinobacteria bacterium]|nr:MAG: hypothetical protein E6G45_11310 [Actinomycetota bacterium]
MIYLRDHVTGDGLAAALLLCSALKRRTLREAAAVLPRYPQVQESVPAADRELPPSLLAEVERINSELGDRGRVLVRPSGTEPVVRVLAEAQDFAEARELCGTISPTPNAGGRECRALARFESRYRPDYLDSRRRGKELPECAESSDTSGRERASRF